MEYIPLIADDLQIMHILVINSTICAVYCTVKLIFLFVGKVKS